MHFLVKRNQRIIESLQSITRSIKSALKPVIRLYCTSWVIRIEMRDRDIDDCTARECCLIRQNLQCAL